MGKIIQQILVGVFLILIVIGGYFFLRTSKEKKEPANVVIASGRIEGDEYNAATKIPGKVERILVEEGQDVKKGQLIATLHAPQLEYQLEAAKKEVNLWQNRVTQAEFALAQSKAQTNANISQAEANLEVNASQLNKAQASYRQNVAQLEQAKLAIKQSQLDYEQAKANLQKAKANLDYNEKEYARFKNLLKEDVVPKSRFDAVETQYITSKAEYIQAKKELGKARVGIENSLKNYNVMSAIVDTGAATVREGESLVSAGQANVNLARTGIYDVRQKEEEVKNARAMLGRAMAQMDSARADIEDTKVFSPIDGRITNKIVEAGEVVSSGTPIVNIVNMDNLYLKVFISTEKEGIIKIGDKAKIIPDALEKESFEGVVSKIASKAEFTPKNVETKEQRSKLVFEVKIKIKDNKDRKLKPGMPAEAKIFVGTSTGERK